MSGCGKRRILGFELRDFVDCPHRTRLAFSCLIVYRPAAELLRL
jgi:hypothetical protein